MFDFGIKFIERQRASWRLHFHDGQSQIVDFPSDMPEGLDSMAEAAFIDLETARLAWNAIMRAQSQPPVAQQAERCANCQKILVDAPYYKRTEQGVRFYCSWRCYL